MNDADFAAYVDHLTANTSTVSAGSSSPSLTLNHTLLQDEVTDPWESAPQYIPDWDDDHEPDLSFDE